MTHDDGDGIAANVDLQPSVFSNVASDVALGGTTTITITDRAGLILTVADAVDPILGTTVGLHFTVSANPVAPGPVGPPGTGPVTTTISPPPASATIVGCAGNYRATLTAGDDVIVTCGSLTAKVISGPVEITIPNGGGTVVVPTGSTAKVDTLASGEPNVTVLVGTATITAPDGTKATLATGPTQFLCNGHVATMVGTNGPDHLKGTDGPDVIVALGGDDKIEAGGGNDIICAGDGNDKIEAGDGDDYVDAGAGDDKIEGGAGNDLLLGGPGNDKIEGGGGKDTINGGPGTDKCQTSGKNNPAPINCE